MAKPMSKSKIVATLADKTGMTKKAVNGFFDALFALAVKEAKSAGKFVIPGLGRAVKRQTKARMGRNPQTGEAIKIPAKRVLKFRIAKAMKESALK